MDIIILKIGHKNIYNLVMDKPKIIKIFTFLKNFF